MADKKDKDETVNSDVEAEYDNEEEDDSNDDVDEEEEEDDSEDADEPSLSEHGKEIYGLNVEIKSLRERLEIAYEETSRVKDFLSKSRQHVKLLLKEMDCRANDLGNLHKLSVENRPPDDWKTNFMNVLQRHNQHDAIFTNHKFDTRLLPAVNKNWQDQLWLVGGVLAAAAGNGTNNSSNSSNSSNNSNNSSQTSNNSNNSNENENNLNNSGNESKSGGENGFAMGQLLDEMKGRCNDFEELMRLYDPNNEKNRAESQADSNETRQVFEQLIEKIEKRQKTTNQMFEKSSSSIKSLVKENNKEWTRLLKMSGQSQQATEELVHELQARTVEFDRVLNVFKGDEFPSILTEIADNCRSRHKSALAATAPRPYLAKRASNISNNNSTNDTRSSSDLLSSSWVSRGVTDSRVIRNNQEWQESLVHLCNNPLMMRNGGGNTGSEYFEARIAIFAREMEERSNQDMAELKKLFIKFNNFHNNFNHNTNSSNNSNNSSISNSTDVGYTIEDLQNDCNGFLRNIKDRHTESETDMKGTYLDNEKFDNIVNFESEEQNNELISQMSANNRDWRAAVGKLLAQVSHLARRKNNNNNNYSSSSNNNSLGSGTNSLNASEKSPNSVSSDNSELYTITRAGSVYFKFGSNGLKSKSNSADAPEMEENETASISNNNNNNMTSLKEERELEIDEIDDQISPNILQNMENIVSNVSNNNNNNENQNQNEWWLDRNEMRSDFVSRIQVDQMEHEALIACIVYLNRVFANVSETSKINKNNENMFDLIKNLYVPMDEFDNYHMLSIVYDGVLVCNLFNVVDPLFVDTRCIHVPDNLNVLMPLSEVKVEENVTLALASAKALGLRLPSYEAKSWMHQKHHVPILLALVDQLHKEVVGTKMKFEKHPELARLLKQKEDVYKVKMYKADEWIKRWLNFILNRPVLSAIGDYNVDLWEVLGVLEGSSFTSNAPASEFNDNPDECSKYLLEYVKNELNINTSIEASDLVNEYIKCQEYLISQIFDLKNNLSALNAQEMKEYSCYWIDDNPDDDQFLPWLNGMLPPHLQVSNLYKDLSSGVVLLKILEKLRPGVVDWKKMRQNVRHKFDRIHNCNNVIKLCESDAFNFRVVGIGGTDLVDGHKKYIETLLWQIMKYQSTRTISQLSSNSNDSNSNVSDKDILKWAQNTHAKGIKLKSENIKNLRDKSLNTSVFYIELMKIVLKDLDKSESEIVVKDEFVKYEIKNGEEDKLSNARYIINLLRRYGSEIFIQPSDLVDVEAKAVLTTLANLMTLDFRLNAKEKEME